MNLQKELEKNKEKRLQESEKTLAYYKDILDAAHAEDMKTLARHGYNISGIEHARKIVKQDRGSSGHIYRLNEIRRIAIKYRLRFASIKRYKKPIPPVAAQKIRDYERSDERRPWDQKLMILAPQSHFHLEKRPKTTDPLLFAENVDGSYTLLYKWGRNINPLRSLWAWPMRTRRIQRVICTMMGVWTFLGIMVCMIEHSQTGSKESVIALITLLTLGVVGTVFTWVRLFDEGENSSELTWGSRYD